MAERQKPPYRRLRGYAFDPGYSTRLETATINKVVFKIPWEAVSEGPCGEYIEVIDYDPASSCFYAPLDLNNPEILAQDGLAPSEGDPRFHQQMVYAVSMLTIKNFEHALGRKALWSPHYIEQEEKDNTVKKDKTGKTEGSDKDRERYVQTLRIYPHALREANAFYSPAKKALLFGYFPASLENDGSHYPGGMVFTCLSHDIIAHETAHALLDGMHRRFIEPTHPDSLAFHEAFADLVALFQHFTFPEVLKHQIAKTRGDLGAQNMLGELAQQFGQAIGNHGSLRDAIGEFNEGKWRPLQPDPEHYILVTEPHARGAILVAAVFDAFISIYKSRVADLLRISSNGTGILPEGAIHPDLVNRLAQEASKTAQHILNMCIRALDYCPPVDITFGDYLRAMITADIDLVPDDDKGYRIAMVEAFRRRGIFPRDVRTLSEESLRWQVTREGIDAGELKEFAHALRVMLNDFEIIKSRKDIYTQSKEIRRKIHNYIKYEFKNKELFENLAGLVLRKENNTYGVTTDKAKGEPVFEVHAVRQLQRVGPDGDSLNHVIVNITQKRKVKLADGREILFRGGSNLIIDIDNLELKYAITKRVTSESRLEIQKKYIEEGRGGSLKATYFASSTLSCDEPFALLHRGSENLETKSLY